MPLVDKAFPDLQAFQEQARLRGDRFTDLEGVVGPGFDYEDVLNSLMAKCQCRRATGDPSAKYDD
jgi:hypothetical protein